MSLLFKAEATKGFLESFIKDRDGRVNVVYEQIEEPVATKDGSNYSLVLPPPSVDNEEEWHGKSHKELSYLVPENQFLFDAQNRYKKGSPHHLAASVIADNIAERRDFGEYVGRSKFLAQNRSRISKNIVDNLRDSDPSQLTPESEMLRSLMQYDISTRKQWMDHGSMKSIEDLRNCQYEGNLHSAFGSDGFPVVDTTQEFQKLVERVVYIMEEPPEPPPSDGKGNGDGQSDDSEGESDAESGENDGQGEGQEGQNGQGEEGSDAEDKGQGSKGSAEDGQGNEGDNGDSLGQNEDLNMEKGSGSDSISSVGTGVDPTKDQQVKDLIQDNFKDMKDTKTLHERKQKVWHKSPSRYIPCSRRRIVTGSQLDLSFKQSQQGRYGSPNSAEILRKASEYPISKGLRKHLQVLSNTAYQYGLKKGRISSSRMARVLLKEKEPRVFKKKMSSRLLLDTTISVLTDCSGSMHGRKERVASIINVCVHDVLKSIRIPYELVGFSDSHTLNHMIFKDYTENTDRETLAKRLCSSAKTSGGNSDGDSLMWACERLAYRKERKKVMIVLSDGQPAGSYVGNGSRYLKRICERIEQESPIDLWGVGILTTAPANYYKNHFICSELKQLEAIVIDILKQSIIKG